MLAERSPLFEVTGRISDSTIEGSRAVPASGCDCSDGFDELIALCDVVL